jgi:hypothetical protein
LELRVSYVNGATGFFCLSHNDLRVFEKVGRGSQEDPFGIRDLQLKANKERCAGQ